MFLDDKEWKMVAPDIDRLIRAFGRGMRNPEPSTDTLRSAFQLIVSLLEPLASAVDNDEVKSIWIRIPRGDIQDYDSFEYLRELEEITTYEEYEELWREDYPDEYNWYRLVVIQSFDNEDVLQYYGLSLGNSTVISATTEEEEADFEANIYEEIAVKICELIMPAIEKSMKLLLAGDYNTLVEKELPYIFRTGVIKRRELWDANPDRMELDYDGLSDETVNEFISLIQSGNNSDERIGRICNFTANDFFNACKLGYEAIGYDCRGFSLSELYLHYSDGRDEGLTGKGHGLNAGIGVDFDDSKEWDEWYFNREQHGGHPWEVVPGGNSTNMQLQVLHDESKLGYLFRKGEITKNEYEEKQKEAGYYFAISGINRRFESVNFYLTLSKAGLPVIIRDDKELVDSFKGEDYIGIVPHHIIPKYCADLFPKEYGHVIDYMHAYKDDDWFDKIIWLQEEPALLRNM